MIYIDGRLPWGEVARSFQIDTDVKGGAQCYKGIVVCQTAVARSDEGGETRPGSPGAIY